mmetsp:Transcript_13655/g.45533  ORF Transcript_13655/g.45533 Transcript_13655/m.45533 type:complete len:280 (+) Transcript_13655:458-1297(+)
MLQRVGERVLRHEQELDARRRGCGGPVRRLRWRGPHVDVDVEQSLEESRVHHIRRRVLEEDFKVALQRVCAPEVAKRVEESEFVRQRDGIVAFRPVHAGLVGQRVAAVAGLAHIGFDADLPLHVKFGQSESRIDVLEEDALVRLLTAKALELLLGEEARIRLQERPHQSFTAKVRPSDHQQRLCVEEVLPLNLPECESWKLVVKRVAAVGGEDAEEYEARGGEDDTEQWGELDPVPSAHPMHLQRRPIQQVHGRRGTPARPERGAIPRRQGTSSSFAHA